MSSLSQTFIGKAISNPLKRKTIPVTGRGGLWGSETSRLPHFRINWLTDDGKIVGISRRPPSTAKEDSWYSFLLEAGSTPRT
jgi:hypothetical protein